MPQHKSQLSRAAAVMAVRKHAVHPTSKTTKAAGAKLKADIEARASKRATKEKRAKQKEVNARLTSSQRKKTAAKKQLPKVPKKKPGRRPIAGNDDVFNARRGGLE